MGYENFIGLFATHIVELGAVRRNPKAGKGPIRAFFATNNRGVLNGIVGKTTLHFRAPTHPPPYNAKSRDLFTTWDIFMQDWRNINLRNYEIREVLPLKTQQDINMFWAYFSYILKPMTAEEKLTFMDNRGYRRFTLDGVKKFMEMKKKEELMMQNPQYNRLLSTIDY